jgi:hypothetical protein
MLGYVASMCGFKFHVAVLPAISMFFMAPTLLWLAVVSGPDFRLAFPEPKPASPPPPPPPEARGLVDPEGYGIEALNKSFVSAETYGKSSFRWAILSFFLFITSGCGAILFSSGAVKSGIDSPIAAIVCIGFSIAMFLNCGMFLVRSVVVFRRASRIQDKLLEFQKAITALKFIERTKEKSVSVDPRTVITNLLSPSRSESSAA